MSKRQHLEILRQGPVDWNHWRQQNPEIQPDLRNVIFKRDNPTLSGANLSGVNFYRSSLWRVNLRGADLRGAVLSSVNLNGAILDDANLSGANLRYTRLVGASIQGAILNSSSVYGVSAWNLKGVPKDQSDLVITPPREPIITVDNLEVAQFIYLILNNQKIRDIVDTIGKKSVLILGRFTPEQKPVLDGIRERLRGLDYVPILFDFDKPASRDITETISTLAHISRFIIADITDARSIPQELQLVVPHLPSVPVQPLLLASQLEYGMFEHFRRYPWVLETFTYKDKIELFNSLQAKVIEPAEAKARELAKGNNQIRPS